MVMESWYVARDQSSVRPLLNEHRVCKDAPLRSPGVNGRFVCRAVEPTVASLNDIRAHRPRFYPESPITLGYNQSS